jgi:protein SCO1/2
MGKILRSRWFWPIAGLLIGLAAILILSQALRPHSFSGSLIQSPQPAYDFTLTSADGPVSLSSLNGKVVLIFFGYTHCPDVCPTTLQEMSSVLDLMGNQADRVQPVFVSVDPDRDSPERLKAYLNNLDGRILGITGEQAVIDQIVTKYGVFYQKRVISESGDYLIDHTATSFLVDPQGFLRVVYPYATPAKGIAEDVRYILKH